jgi:hypothetical protein
MDGTTIGWIGAIAGTLIGIAGGAFGTYRSITSAGTPEARKVMVRIFVYVWGLLSVFVALMFALPSPYGFLSWIPFGVAMFLTRRIDLECARSRMGLDSDV